MQVRTVAPLTVFMPVDCCRHFPTSFGVVLRRVSLELKLAVKSSCKGYIHSNTIHEVLEILDIYVGSSVVQSSWFWVYVLVVLLFLFFIL